MTATPAKTLRLRHFIAGQWQSSAATDWVSDLNPSDASDVIAEIPRGTAQDVEQAVGSASDALEPWKSLSGPARADLLYNWGAAIAARQEDMAQVVTREVGKPIAEARGEVARCVM